MTGTRTTTRSSDRLAGAVARWLVVADVENLLGRAPAEAFAIARALAVGHVPDAIGFRWGRTRARGMPCRSPLRGVSDPRGSVGNGRSNRRSRKGSEHVKPE